MVSKMGDVVWFLAGSLSTIALYFALTFLIKLLKNNINRPIIGQGAPLRGPKIIPRTKARVAPKINTEFKEYVQELERGDHGG